MPKQILQLGTTAVGHFANGTDVEYQGLSNVVATQFVPPGRVRSSWFLVRPLSFVLRS